MPLLTEFDLHLLGEGTHARAYEKLGAHVGAHEGRVGTHFAVWAPNAKSVSAAGDFNDWGHTVERMMTAFGLHSHRNHPVPTFPSRMPLVQLDHVYARGLRAVRSFTPRGPIWGRMSDHLPLLVDFEWGDA